ncbi:MAG: RNA 3'-phosphate cyclase [Desulfobacterales bacterium]|nr:RNA 3'-phosphate cyclase [Desulfobacterales bacterium]
MKPTSPCDAMIEIDGSSYSGSGTLVRDAAAFCILKQEGLHITKIREKRPKPGLRAQHLKALEAAAQICGGRLTGAVLGSREITLQPGPSVRGGDFSWNIGSAGSAVMLALTVLPLALFADRPSRYRITGGLFQDFAPSAFHFIHVLLPMLRQMAIQAEARILRPGYVPKGQGVIEVTAAPAAEKPNPLTLLSQGRVSRIRGIAMSSHLREKAVSDRMAAACKKKLAAGGYDPQIEILYEDKKTAAYRQPAVQPGAALAVWAETDTGCRLGADMAGARGRSSEVIGRQTAVELLEDLGTGATVDRHLADQLIPFAALADGQSAFRIPQHTEHVTARLWLVETLLGAGAEVDGDLLQVRGRTVRR